MNEYIKPKLLTFKVTTSKGVNTYGYNIVSLYEDGSKVASCNGGGYDMRGKCLGEYLTSHYLPQLEKLQANYGYFLTDNNK